MSEQRDRADFEQGVMVEVGQGNGALVIYTDDALRGEEIEISPRGRDSQRVHTEVLRRKVANGYISAAVFGTLGEGEYRLWHETLITPVEVTIVNGEVTELDWR